MNKRDTKVLHKIYEHISAILMYTSEIENLEDFQNDHMRLEACVFNLMQIGELAKSALSEEAKETIQSIPWKQIYGMRNRIVHGYDGVDMKIVWETIRYDLPTLLEELKKII